MFPVFVLVDNLEENYEEAVNWCYANLNHKNVLSLSLEEVYFLQDNSKVLDLINEENSSMIGVYEDDWISDNVIKTKTLKRLKEYYSGWDDLNGRRILEKIIELFQTSISTNKNIYFHF